MTKVCYRDSYIVATSYLHPKNPVLLVRFHPTVSPRRTQTVRPPCSDRRTWPLLRPMANDLLDDEERSPPQTKSSAHRLFLRTYYHQNPFLTGMPSTLHFAFSHSSPHRTLSEASRNSSASTITNWSQWRSRRSSSRLQQRTGLPLAQVAYEAVRTAIIA